MLLARKKRVQFATLLYQSHLTFRNIGPTTARYRWPCWEAFYGAGLEAWWVVEEMVWLLVCTGLEATEVHRFGEKVWLSVTKRSAAMCSRPPAGRLLGRRHSLELYRRQTHALHHPQRVLLSKMEQLQTHNLMVWSGRSGNQKRSVNWSAIFIIGSKPKSTISFWWCNDHEHNCWLHLLFQ